MHTIWASAQSEQVFGQTLIRSRAARPPWEINLWLSISLLAFYFAPTPLPLEMFALILCRGNPCVLSLWICRTFLNMECSGTRQTNVLVWNDELNMKQWIWHYQYGTTRSLGARLLGSGPSGRLWALRACLTSSFPAFGRSGRVTHATEILFFYYY